MTQPVPPTPRQSTIREVLFPFPTDGSAPRPRSEIEPVPAVLLGETPQETFRVDPEAGATPVAKLQEAVDRLEGTLVLLQRDGLIEPPAADHVSARIAQNVNLMFANAREYVRVLHEQVVAARDALTAQFDA